MTTPPPPPDSSSLPPAPAPSHVPRLAGEYAAGEDHLSMLADSSFKLTRTEKDQQRWLSGTWGWLDESTVRFQATAGGIVRLDDPNQTRTEPLKAVMDAKVQLKPDGRDVVSLQWLGRDVALVKQP